MKISKNMLKRIIKEEIGRYILYEQHGPGPMDRTGIPGHGRPPEGAPTPESSGKTALSRDEQIVQWATQIASIADTGSPRPEQLQSIGEFANDIISLVNQPADSEDI